MLPSFFTDSIAVITPTETTKNGKPFLDWDNPTYGTISGCYVEPAMSDRDFDGRQVSVADEWTLYLPASATVSSSSRIEWQGEPYQINGAVQAWRSPSGRITHQQARLKRWSG